MYCTVLYQDADANRCREIVEIQPRNADTSHDRWRCHSALYCACAPQRGPPYAVRFHNRVLEPLQFDHTYARSHIKLSSTDHLQQRHCATGILTVPRSSGGLSSSLSAIGRGFVALIRFPYQPSPAQPSESDRITQVSIQQDASPQEWSVVEVGKSSIAACSSNMVFPDANTLSSICRSFRNHSIIMASAERDSWRLAEVCMTVFCILYE